MLPGFSKRLNINRILPNGFGITKNWPLSKIFVKFTKLTFTCISNHLIHTWIPCYHRKTLSLYNNFFVITSVHFSYFLTPVFTFFPVKVNSFMPGLGFQLWFPMSSSTYFFVYYRLWVLHVASTILYSIF